MTAGVIKEIADERHIRLAAWIQIAVVAGLVVPLYADVLADLASEWWNISASSYGMLIPPLAGYIAFMRRGTLFSIPVQPDSRGLWLIALASLLLIGGRLAAEFYLSRISIVLLAAGLVW